MTNPHTTPVRQRRSRLLARPQDRLLAVALRNDAAGAEPDCPAKSALALADPAVRLKVLDVQSPMLAIALPALAHRVEHSRRSTHIRLALGPVRAQHIELVWRHTALFSSDPLISSRAKMTASGVRAQCT
jgi:hypothetical protein